MASDSHAACLNDHLVADRNRRGPPAPVMAAAVPPPIVVPPPQPIASGTQPPPPMPMPPPEPKEEKKRVPPSPYCDFCLGDSSENKKTGHSEQLVSCADCGRSGKIDSMLGKKTTNAFYSFFRTSFVSSIHR